MVIVWRGAGLIVPGTFLICGWIVSYFYTDTRLGNPSFIGWTFFYTGLALLLPGIAMFGTKNEDGTPRRKHDFFFIPVIFWSFLLLIGSTVILLSRSSSGDDNSAAVMSDTTQVVMEDRVINVLNTSDDTLKFVIGGEEGVIKRIVLEPHSWEDYEVQPGAYLFSGYNMDNDVTLSLPDSFYMNDRSRYVVKKDGDGKYYARLLNEPTPSKMDYDDAWFIVDGTRDMMVVEVTPLCATRMTKKDVEQLDWTQYLDKVYDGRDMIEPQINPERKGEVITVLEPGESLPATIKTNERVYALISVSREQAIDSKYLADRLYSLFYEE